MANIEVDFEVFKELTSRRQTEATTYNDVLRELLGLGPINRLLNPASRSAWQYQGATFPHGTEFRATYKGKQYVAKVIDGALIYDGKSMNSPSEAASAVTGNNVNGWRFWQYRQPGEGRWRPLTTARWI